VGEPVRAMVGPFFRDWSTNFLALWFMAAIAASTPGNVAQAESWKIAGQASQSLIFDSNIRLSPSNPETVFGSATVGSGSIEKLGARASTKILGDVNIRRYIGNPDLNAEDFGVGVESSLRAPRSIFDFRGSIRRTSTLITEETDAGRFQQIANQMLLDAQSTWQYQLSPLSTLGLSGAAIFRTYDRTGFADQLGAFASATWGHKITSSDIVSLIFRAGVLNANGQQDTTTHSYSLLLGWSRPMGDRLTFEGAAGPRLAFTRRSGFGRATDDQVSLGADASIKLRYRASVRTAFSIVASQSLEPSSNGEVQQRQRLAMTAEHEISQRLRAIFTTFLQRNEQALGNLQDSQERLYLATGVNVSYRISQSLVASSQYTFRSQFLTGEGAPAFSHRVVIVLSYSPRSWSFRD
jgi:hypothetical protein